MFYQCVTKNMFQEQHFIVAGFNNSHKIKIFAALERMSDRLEGHSALNSLFLAMHSSV